MTDQPRSHRRRSIRYKGYDYTQPGAYFVTIGAFERKFIFGKIINNEIQLYDLGRIAYTCWQQIPNHFTNVEVEPFVIMPNHIHGIITILDDDRSGTVHRRGTIYRAPTMDTGKTREEFGKPVPGSLATIIRTYKAAVSRIARKELGMVNIWQRNYYEHIVRNQMELEKIGKYILANPQQWADDPENVSLLI